MIMWGLSSAVPTVLPNTWSLQPMPQPEICVTGVTLHTGPFHNTGNATSNPYSSTVEAKKFLLYRSLFDLVYSLHCLELQDKRLMAWYFNLSDEDRRIIQEEGGLHEFILGHPALEVSKHIGIVHVKSQIRKASMKISTKLNNSKYPTVNGMSCKNYGTSSPSESNTCRTFDPVAEEETSLRGQKTKPGVWCGNSHGATGEQVTQDSFQSAFDDSHTSPASPSPRRSICSQAQHFSNEWREGQSSVRSSTVSASKDASVQANFSFDMEPERHSKMVQASSPPACPNHQAECETLTDNKSYLGQNMSPEYYSFNSTMFDQTSAELEANSSQSAKHDGIDSAVSVSGPSCPLEWINFDATADESLQNNPRDEFHSATEESGPPDRTHASPSQKPQVDPAVKLGAGKGQQSLQIDGQSVFISPDKSEDKLPVSAALHPATVSQAVDATSDFRACFTSTQESEAVPSTTDASTETDRPKCLEQHTQTIPAPTAEKSVITEVYIADLDFLTKEFLRLKSVEEEMEQLKANQLKPTMECGCECAQRLKQADLRLLVLQYAVCQDHCWRRYYNSEQGETALQCTGGIPESLAETLRALEQDYIQMRRQVLSGVALDDLTPLSVDTHRLHTESQYTPAQKMNEYLKDKVPLESTAGQLKNETNRKIDSFEEDKAGKPAINSKKDALGTPGMSHTKPGGDTSSMVVSIKTQKSDTSQYPETLIPDGPKEGEAITSEDWYDAEEDIGATGQSLKVIESERNGKVGDGDGKKISSHVCIVDLPNDVTEEDLLLLLEKYQPREVFVFAISNTFRIATVTVSSPENAEAALQDLSGSSIHGQPIQVRRISRLPAAGPEGSRTFRKPHTPSATRPAASGNVPKPESVKKTTPYSMSPKPIRYHIEKLVNISNVPTATGTYVPWQPAANTTTTGNFDALMVQLSERHPEVARQTFVEALLELRAQHRGSLSSLPLGTIVEMTSKILTAQALGSE